MTTMHDSREVSGKSMWYVIQTMTGEEHECVRLCKKRIKSSFYREIFVPMYIDKMHFRKEWHDIKKPLFPGYFFIDTEEIEPILQDLKKLGRFARALKNADAVTPITAEEQQFLQDMMNEEYTIHCSTGFIIGDKICITEGPLRNHYGLIKKVDRHRRVAKLEIDFFGRMTPAEVGLEILARLTEEEFQELKGKKIEEQKCSQKDSAGRHVQIISGVFAGMSGELASVDEEKGEWRVRIDLFGAPSEVVFSKEEIRG